MQELCTNPAVIAPLAGALLLLLALPWLYWPRQAIRDELPIICTTFSQIARVRIKLWIKRRWWFIAKHFWCRFKGHDFSGDSGLLLGLNQADVWCKRCDHFTQIPLAESKYAIRHEEQD